jgi:deoxyribodipyrimidine photo-lyase
MCHNDWYQAREVGAKAVFYNRLYDPWKLDRDRDLEAALTKADVAVRSFNASLLYEPWDVTPDSPEGLRMSGYGSVRFFLNGCTHLPPVPDPLPAPPAVPSLAGGASWPQCCGLARLGLADMPRTTKR